MLESISGFYVYTVVKGCIDTSFISFYVIYSKRFVATTAAFHRSTVQQNAIFKPLILIWIRYSWDILGGQSL